MAMPCGYGAASLTKRVYGWPEAPQRDTEAGLLICIMASDSEGALRADILSAALDREIRCVIRGPEDFKAAIAHGGTAVESWYAEAGVEFTRQVIDGRMGYIGTVRDDVEFVAGRPAITLRQWAAENRDRLGAESKP